MTDYTNQLDVAGPRIVTDSAQATPAPPWTLYSERQRWGLLAILFLVATSNYFDRNVISVLIEPMKHEFKVSDTMLGLLGGFCFALFYALAGMPIARWADRGNRRTVITLALTVWSIMTIGCGLARTFLQLAIARVGVGAGEGGAIPPAQSLIADYFPPEQRATAIAIFTSAASAGQLLGMAIGGYIAATYGWRYAFLVGGAPGLLLALIVRFGLSEPRLQQGFATPEQHGESIWESLSVLMRKRSYVFALAGNMMYFLYAYGCLIFVVSYLIRVLHLPLKEVSAIYSAVGVGSSVIGTLGGGWLADRLGRRDVRWLAWLTATACAVSGPIIMFNLTLNSFPIFLALSFLTGIMISAGLPSAFAAIHAVCGNRRRATAIAIVFFSATLFGGGFGPLITGALSDSLSHVYGALGLRYALIMMSSLLIAAGFFFYLFGRAMPGDIED